MKTLVLVFHPDLTTSRVNKQLALAMRNQNDVTVHDVYQAYPDEKIDVQAEQTLLEAHDRIILQFPLYWYSTPPLLKKWQDVVLKYGWAYGSTGKKLQEKELLLAVTAGDAEENFTPNGAAQFSMIELLRPLQATFCTRAIGMIYLNPFVLYRVGKLSNEERQQCAKAYVEYGLATSIKQFN